MRGTRGPLVFLELPGPGIAKSSQTMRSLTGAVCTKLLTARVASAPSGLRRAMVSSSEARVFACSLAEAASWRMVPRLSLPDRPTWR
jgi:hypothetical protein